MWRVCHFALRCQGCLEGLRRGLTISRSKLGMGWPTASRNRTYFADESSDQVRRTDRAAFMTNWVCAQEYNTGVLISSNRCP